MSAKTSAPAPEEPLGSAADAVVDALTVTQQEALQTLESASAAMLAGVGTVQREIADFVAERIRSDMDTQAALIRCKSFADVRVVQGKFLRTAYDQYAGEASRLVRLSGKMMAQTLNR